MTKKLFILMLCAVAGFSQLKGASEEGPPSTPKPEKEVCAICLEPLHENPTPSTPITLQCDHNVKIHNKCLAQWDKQSEEDGFLVNCPLCRAGEYMPSFKNPENSKNPNGTSEIALRIKKIKLFNGMNDADDLNAHIKSIIEDQ
ncbi:RING finger domain-containing protein [Candidatus Dependentiae bacterium]